MRTAVTMGVAIATMVMASSWSLIRSMLLAYRRQKNASRLLATARNISGVSRDASVCSCLSRPRGTRTV